MPRVVYATVLELVSICRNNTRRTREEHENKTRTQREQSENKARTKREQSENKARTKREQRENNARTTREQREKNTRTKREQTRTKREQSENKASVNKLFHVFYKRYENVIFMGYFNSEICEEPVKNFCSLYNIKNLIKHPTCFKTPDNPTCIDLILKHRSFQNTSVIETGLSDFHRLTTTEMNES